MIDLILSGGVALSFQPDLIDPSHPRRVAIRNHEWRDVLHNLRTSAGDCETPDATELMDRRQPADDSMITHLNVTREGAVIRKDDRVSDGAIVADMRISEEVSADSQPAFSRQLRCFG